MAVSIKGSAFYFGDQVDAPEASFSNFFEWLKKEARPDRPWPFYKTSQKSDSYKRQLYFDFNGKYWFGIFLSAKTNEFQHYVKQVEGKIIVEAKEVGNNPPVEMNFFCIRRDSCKGIFSHYIGSYQFNTFISDLWALYRYFVEIKKAPALEEKEKTAEKKKVSKQFSLSEKCNSGALFDPKGFNEVLDKMRKIDTVRLTTYEIDSPDDEPVSNRVRNVHKTYRFSMEDDVDTGLRTWVKKMRAKSARKLKSGKEGFTGSVLGMDGDGKDVYLNFGKTMKDFLNYDYDELGTFSLNDIFSHALITGMVSRMNDGILFRVSQKQ